MTEDQDQDTEVDVIAEVIDGQSCTFRVIQKSGGQFFVGTCDEYPGLAKLTQDRTNALLSIKRKVQDRIKADRTSG